MEYRSSVKWDEDGMRVCVEGHDLVPSSLDVFLASVYGDVSMDSYHCFHDIDSYIQRRQQRRYATSQGNRADAYDAFMVLCENISPKCSLFKAMREVCREANSKLKKRITAVRGFFVEPFFTFVQSLPNANSVFIHALDESESALIDNHTWWRMYCDSSSRVFETFLLSAHQMTEVHFVSTRFPDQSISSLVNCLERSAVKRIVFEDKDDDMIRAPSAWFASPWVEATWSGENRDKTLIVYEAAQRWSLRGITTEVQNVFAVRPSLVHSHMAEVELRENSGYSLIQDSELESTPWHELLCDRLNALAKSDILMLRSITLCTEAFDVDCVEIVSALSASSCLQSIDLSRNFAGLKTARALAQLSTVCPHVKYLGLSDAFNLQVLDERTVLSSVFSVPWPALRVLTFNTTEVSLDFLMNDTNVPSCVLLSASLDGRWYNTPFYRTLNPMLGVREAFLHGNRRFFLPFD